MAQQILSTNTFTTAKWIVSATASDGTHTTIGAALTSASSGDTIFIRPGTYTENLTLKAGVNLTAFESDSSLNGTGKVIISGTCTLTTAGSVTISGIQLQTNSAALLAVTGTLNSIVNLNNCYLNCTNNSGITYSSSGATSAINLYNCNGDIGTTGITLFVATGSGSMTIKNCKFTNSGLSTTASSTSACSVGIQVSQFNIALSTSSSGVFGIGNSSMETNPINTTCLTTAGTGSCTTQNTYYAGGSASALSIGTGTTVSIQLCNLSSSNTNVITGAGTIIYSGLTFTSSSTINTTTQTSSGTLQGSKNTAPAGGYLGEQIRSYATKGSVGITNATPVNITSISLTAGVWDISAVVEFGGATTGSFIACCITTTTGTLNGNEGDNQVQFPLLSQATSEQCLCIPSYRQVISATTTYYLVAQMNYTVGTGTGGGRLSAVRVG